MRAATVSLSPPGAVRERVSSPVDNPLGAAGVMVMLGIADDARVRDLTAEQRGQITDAIAATAGPIPVPRMSGSER